MTAGGRSVGPCHQVGPFAGFKIWTHDDSALFIDGARVCHNTSLVEKVAAGDHTVVVMRINSLTFHSDVAPIVFHRGVLRGLDKPAV